MRSEELHRCAEFVGITEVVNSSLYLVDLIGGRDIERAIVGPAQRLLRAWELDPGDADTGPYTRRALRELHQVFNDGRETLRHPADQLPLMQHLLPLIWDKAVERWEASPDDAPLQIGLDDLHALPGWKSPDGPLIGTLNERADDVLRRAVEAGAVRGGGLDKGAVERALRVAFCCLAQLDDRGNVVRDFATLDQMLESSGALDRHPERKEAWKEALRAAFEVFERATLVNVERNYDVNHEALIRGWRTYSNWLKDARRRMDLLEDVDRKISDIHVPEWRPSLPVRLWRALKDIVLVQTLARADSIVGKQAGDELQDVFGPNSAFSERWAKQTLERADAASSSFRHDERPILERLGAIRQTLQNALRYRAGAKHRPGIILASGLVGLLLLGAMGVGLAYYMRTSSAQAGLNEQFRFFRLQGEATYIPPDRPPRNPNQDRELYAALELAPQRAGLHVDKVDVDESSAVFRTSLRQLDKGARSVLAEGSVVRILSNTEADDLAELRGLENFAANCDVADVADFGDEKRPSRVRAMVGANGLGIELRPQMAGGVLTTTMVPIWRASDSAIAEIETSNFSGQAVPSGAIVCLSHDANWLLTWPPLPGNQLGSPPLIQRIIWIRTGPLADRDRRWRAELNPPRRPDTAQSWSDLEDQIDLNEEYPKLHQDAREGGRNFRSFRNGDNVGFLIAMKDSTAMLWTVTGLLDPVPVQPGTLKRPLKDCPFIKVPPEVDQTGASRTFMRCEMGPIAFDGLHHMLRARYELVELKIQLQSASTFQVQSAQNDAPCEPENALCRTELRIEYDPQHPQRESVRAALLHLSSRIKAAAIWNDSLWIQDANDQIWRYTVGFDVIKKLLPERWKGVDKEYLAKLGYSEACRDVKCDTVNIVGWPKRQQETAR
jgi:hypothetical protein